MDDEKKYYNRELSWLSFNELVLENVKDTCLPLYERIKFLAIYSTNLDEFYRVRVAYCQSLLGLGDKNKKKLDFLPEELLNTIKIEVTRQLEEYYNIFKNIILPELDAAGVILYQNQELNERHKQELQNFFLSEVLPHMQPILLTPGDVLTFLQDNVIYLAIKMFKKRKKSSQGRRKKATFAVLKIPTNHINRFIEISNFEGKFFFFFLDDVIRQNLDFLFPGFIIDSSFSVKVSRDADLNLEDEFGGNLVEKIKKSLSKRKTGTPARFLHDKNIPSDLMDAMKLAFNLSETDLAPAGKYLNFSDFFSFPNPCGSKYELEKLPKLSHKAFNGEDTIISAMKKKEILLHFPYQTYDYVLRFFNEAAIDPKVLEIKTTQYRVATNSAIVNALITAARNGKKVTVFVEVKARFNEAENINFAAQMKQAGIKVIAGIPGLKVHAKTALVIRKSSSKPNSTSCYGYVCTGNFNEKTARIYADEGFFTTDMRIINDINKLFQYIENPDQKFSFEHILVPKFNFNEEIFSLMANEVKNIQKGNKGYVILKMNGLQEQGMIDQIYKTASKGVSFDLIVRGICCLRPNMPFSKGIKVIRIVDRYLEHARIFAFYNNGNWKVYISSSDMMNRNLKRRVEITIPIYNEQLKNEIIETLKIQLTDNTSARLLDENIKNNFINSTDKGTHRAQTEIYAMLQENNILK